MVDIKDISGNILLSTPINEGCKRKFTLMKEDFITLKFSLENPIYFKLGSYVECDFGLFEVCDLQKPSFNVNTAGYDYDLRLDAHYWKWKNKIFKYTPEAAGQEASWNLTAPLDVQAGIVLRNLKALGYTYKGLDFVFSIDSTVEDKAQLMCYDNTDILDACFEMAKKWDCECWVTENIIHFGRCEFGDSVDFEIGKNVEEMTRSDSQSDYATRIYAFGSTRNIPATYRKKLVFDVKSLSGKNMEDTARKLDVSYFPSKDYNPRKIFTATFNVVNSDKEGLLSASSQYPGSFPATTYRIGLSGVDVMTDLPLLASGELSIDATVMVDNDKVGTFTKTFHVSSHVSHNHLEDVLVTLPKPGSTNMQILITATVRNGDNIKNNLDLGISGNADVCHIYDSANVRLSFRDGALKGRTITGVLNASRQKGGSAITLDSDILPSAGDTYTIDNIIQGKVPSSYFTNDIDGDMAVNGVVQKRLMLPADTPYIDAYEGMSTEEAIEQVVVFDDIYPRRTGTMSDITTHEYTDTNEDTGEVTKWNAYRFKDTGITFSKEYVLPGEELRITFQSGKLNGMASAVTFNPCDKEGGETPVPEKNGDGVWNPAAQVWEIVRNDDYGRNLPGDALIPSDGDTYVLSGWDSTYISESGLVSSAEQELKAEAGKYMEKAKVDPSTYQVKMMSDDAYMEDGIHNLYGIGQKVNLINKAYFENGRQSRVIGFEFNLDIPWDCPVYTVGETAAYSRIGELENKIESLTFKGQAYTGGGGSGVYLITSNDSTPATDSNAFSSKRALKMFLRKDQGDETPYPVKFREGLSVGENLLLRLLLTGDNTSLTDEDVFSALRTVAEISGRALSRLKDDTALGNIDFAGSLSIRQKKLSEIIRYFDEERGVSTDASVYTALMTDERIREEFGRIGDKFIRKDIPDAAHKRITFEDGITVYDLARMLGIEVSGLATIAQAVVGILRSSKFVDGFAGEGFQIWKDLASGDWNLAIDRVTVRKVMSIYELVIQKVRSAGGSIVVSAGNGKVASVGRTGDEYVFTFEDVNSFRYCDLARCQVFTGRDVKYYWVRISSVRGDKVYVPVSEFAGAVPEAGDEWVLMGNSTDRRRQNFILISATEDGQPRIDIYDGVKEKNFEGCLRTRLGNLDGISDGNFPPDMQPRGDGLYGNNCFLTGVFVLSNGKDVMTQFEIMEGLVKSEISSVRHEANARDNYLSNSSFTSDMEGWQAINDIRMFTVGGKLLYFNRNYYSEKKSVASVTDYGGRNVLRLRYSSIMQKNSDFARHPSFKDAVDADFNPTGLKQAGMFHISFKYKVAERGTLKVYFTNDASDGGFEPFDKICYEGVLPETAKFEQFEVSGKWDGRGDLMVEFSGDMYMHSLALTSNSINDLYDKFSTRIEQTDKKIQANADEIHRTSESLEEYHTELTITARGIRSEMSEEVGSLGSAIEGVKGDLSSAEGRITTAYRGEIEASARGLKAVFDQQADTLTDTLEKYHSDFELTAKDMRLEFQEDVNGLSSDITGVSDKLSTAEARITTAYKGEVATSAQALTADFTSRLTNLETGVEKYQTAIDVSAKGLAAKFSADIADMESSISGISSGLAATETRITTAYKGEIAASAKGLTAEFQKKVDTVYDDLFSAEARITTAYEGKVAASAQALTADFNSRVSGVEGSLANHTGSYHVSSSEISAMVSATDTLRNTINSAGWLTTAEGNSLWASKSMEDGETLVSRINQTASSIKIEAKNIKLEGLVTANENFQILPDGSMRTNNAHLSGSIYTPFFIITEANWRDSLLVDYDIFPYLNLDVTGLNVQINYWPDLSPNSSVASDILSFPHRAEYLGCEANVLVMVSDTTEMQAGVVTCGTKGSLYSALLPFKPYEFVKFKLVDCKGLGTNNRYEWVIVHRATI